MQKTPRHGAEFLSVTKRLAHHTRIVIDNCSISAVEKKFAIQQTFFVLSHRNLKQVFFSSQL
jgi:hypothetical protein